MSSLTDQYRAKLTGSRLMNDPEELLTSPAGFGVTQATVLQRAVAWVMCCGYCPDRLWAEPDVQEAFGGVRPGLKSFNEMGVFAGIRGGKTIMAGLAVVFATQNIDLSKGRGASLIRGEVPRVSIVSVSKDQAENAFNYIRGAVEGSSALSPLLVGKPTTDTITLRHPSGRDMEICVVAGSKAGSSLVGRWCAGVIFDEAPLMSLEDDGLINIRDMATNVRPRMLGGAKILYIGSPWGNDGFIYNICQDNFGKADQKVVVVRARGDKLNPTAWTKEEQEFLRDNDERSYRVNFLAEFMDPESAMYSSASVDLAMRRADMALPPEPGKRYTAAMDPGTRGNAWTFGIAETDDNVRFNVVFACQWRGGSTPLVPSEVFKEMAEHCALYGCAASVRTDQWSVDAMRELALQAGIGLSPLTITVANKTKLYESVKVRLDEKLLELPPDQVMRSDLLNVKKRVIPDGGFKVVLPETNDGRHCDYAAMLALLCGDYLQPSSEAAKMAKKAEVFDDPMEEAEQLPYNSLPGWDNEPTDNQDYESY
jgi:hypothetical protein